MYNTFITNHTVILCLFTSMKTTKERSFLVVFIEPGWIKVLLYLQDQDVCSAIYKDTTCTGDIMHPCYNCTQSKLA